MKTFTKRFALLMAFVLGGLTLSLTSCSDDDKDNVGIDEYSVALIGTWTRTTTDGSGADKEIETETYTFNADNTVVYTESEKKYGIELTETYTGTYSLSNRVIIMQGTWNTGLPEYRKEVIKGLSNNKLKLADELGDDDYDTYTRVK